MSATTTSNDGSTDFLQSYSMHDVASEYAELRLSWYGMVVEAFGIDARHEDNPDGNYGRPDLKVTSQSGKEAYIEVKAKRNDDWMGRCDEWKFENYLQGDTDDDEYDGSDDDEVWIMFLLIDDENDTQTIVREACYPVRSWNQITEVFTTGGQTVVGFYDDEERTWNDMIRELR